MRFSPDPESIQRWKEFEHEPFKSLLSTSQIPAPFIPLNGTRHFSKLSGEEQKRFYLNFVKFTAEFFIVLEILLYVAFRRLRQNSLAQRLVGEENLHSRAFRRYLHQEKALHWKEKPVVLKRNPWLTSFMIRLVRRIPISIALPGAKIEAYSVYYGKLLKQEFGSIDANSWVKLNWLHLLDEAHHVGFEFDIFNEVFSQESFFGKIRAIVGTLIFYLYLQWTLTTGCWIAMKQSLDTDSSLVRKFRIFGPLLLWASFDFPPAQQMRASIRDYYKKKRPRWGSLLWVLWR